MANIDKAKRICLKGSKEGNKICDAIKLYFGWESNQNFQQANQIFEEIISTDVFIEKQDTNIAFFYLAQSYRYGDGVEKEFNKAIEYYKQAILLGNSMALNNLAFIYENGLENVKKNVPKIVKLYQKAVNLQNATSMNNLAIIFEFGAGEVERNFQKALELYEKAAMMGDKDAKRRLKMI